MVEATKSYLQELEYRPPPQIAFVHLSIVDTLVWYFLPYLWNNNVYSVSLYVGNVICIFAFVFVCGYR